MRLSKFGPFLSERGLALLACIALVAAMLTAQVMSAPHASAALYGPIPSDESGDPTLDFLDTDALFVYLRSDIAGGRACVIAEAGDDWRYDSPAPGWNRSTHLVGIGTLWSLLQGPHLPVGRFRIGVEKAKKCLWRPARCSRSTHAVRDVRPLSRTASLPKRRQPPDS